MKKVLLCALLGAAIFTACKKDESVPSDSSPQTPEASPAQLILGKWYQYSIILTQSRDGNVITDTTIRKDSSSMDFRTNNVVYYYDNRNGSDSFTYKLDGDKLIFIYGPNDTDTGTIKSLTKDNFVLYYKAATSSGYYEETMNFKR